jgi:hypothetical protein
MIPSSIATQVIDAQVIGKNEDDVRARLNRTAAGWPTKQQDNSSKQDRAVSFHRVLPVAAVQLRISVTTLP